jgi:hypothetical protein
MHVWIECANSDEMMTVMILDGLDQGGFVWLKHGVRTWNIGLRHLVMAASFVILFPPLNQFRPWEYFLVVHPSLFLFEKCAGT